jgi:hypothetical protein
MAGKKLNSVVLAPGMPALGASEEPDLALIGSPELAQPPDGEVVIAFRAADLDGRHGLWLPILFHDNDLLLAALPLFFHLVSPADLPDISASPALELTARRDQHGLAFRAEHRYKHAQAEEINLWILPRRERQRRWYGIIGIAG